MSTIERLAGEPFELTCGEKTLRLAALHAYDFVERRRWAKAELIKGYQEDGQRGLEFAKLLEEGSAERLQAISDARAAYTRKPSDEEINAFLDEDSQTFDYTLYLAAKKLQEDLGFEEFITELGTADQVDVLHAYFIIQGSEVSREDVEKLVKPVEEVAETTDPPALRQAQDRPPKVKKPRDRSTKKPASSTT